jgi:CheY-like chemotaxis protein
MLFSDIRIQQKVARNLQRVLICDPRGSSAKLLAGLIVDGLACEVQVARDAVSALAAAGQLAPQLVFVEHPKSGFDGFAFTRTMRRSDLACRQAAVIMATTEATPTALHLARNSGVHEFLRRPYTPRELQRRLEVITIRPRDWVEAVDYVGPDRRCFNSAEHAAGNRRDDRGETSEQARLVRAMEIVEAAIAARVEQPQQAVRAVRAQAVELIRNREAGPAIKSRVGEIIDCCDRREASGLVFGDELLARSKDLIALKPLSRAA